MVYVFNMYFMYSMYIFTKSLKSANRFNGLPMDQRKLIQHGHSSLTIALPKKWLDGRKLKKGDHLFVEEEGNKVILTTTQPLKLRNISVDLSELDRTSALLYIQSLYRFGYDEIEVKFSKSTTKHYRRQKTVTYSSVVHEIVSRLVGAEVVEETENRILIKYITQDANEDFRIVLRRIFLLLKDTSQSFLDGVKSNNRDLISTIENKHDNINNFVNYCLRLLNKYGYPDVKKTSLYFHLIASIDKIVDVLKYNARDALNYNKKYHRETIVILEKIHHSIELYYNLFYQFDLKKVNELNKNRDEVKQLIEEKMKIIPHEELIHLAKMVQILEIILDLTDFRMGLEH